MKKIYLIAMFIGIAFGSFTETRGQASDEQQKARDIAALFNRSNRKDNEKSGSFVQISSEIKNEPVVKENISDYSGSYKADSGKNDGSDGGLISLNVETNGEIAVSGYDYSETGQLHYFKLKNAKIKDALLTGTKIYDDGSAEKFEAVFLNRTGSLIIGKGSRNLVTVFGLGVKFDNPKKDISTGRVVNKLLYGKQQRDTKK